MVEDKLLPSPELVLKVKFIGDTKFRRPDLGLALKGEFNRFGLYVQKKEPFYYLAGGKYIPKLEFGMELDFKSDPFVGWKVAVRKYKPGDWEKNVDLTYKFARAFHDMVEEEKERRKGPPLTDLYPPDSPELAEALDKELDKVLVTGEARQEVQVIHRLVLQKLRLDTSWQYKNYELSGDEVQFVR